MSQIFSLLESGVTKFGELYAKANNMFEALRSNFSGTSFPTSPTPSGGQTCWRTDRKKKYVFTDDPLLGESGWVEVSIASAGLGAELINARGTKSSLDERLDVSFNDDGTLKASVSETTQSEWLDPQFGAYTYVDSTHFKVSGDQTDIYTVKRRLKVSLSGSTVYTEVLSSSYSSPDTTVNVADAVLTNPISKVEHGIIQPREFNSSLPDEYEGKLKAVKTVSSFPYTLTASDNIVLLNGTGTVNFPQQSAVSTTTKAKEYLLIQLSGTATLSPYAGDSLPVTSLAAGQSIRYIGNGGTAWREDKRVNCFAAGTANTLISGATVPDPVITHTDGATSSEFQALTTPITMSGLTEDAAWHTYTVGAGVKMVLVRVKQTIAADNTTSYVSYYLRPTDSGWLTTSVYPAAGYVRALGATTQWSQCLRDIMIPCNSSGQIDYFIDKVLSGTYSYSGGMYIVGYWV